MNTEFMKRTRAHASDPSPAVAQSNGIATFFKRTLRGVLTVVMMLSSISILHAEDFDELALLGGWELTSVEGSDPFFFENLRGSDGDVTLASCKYMYLGEYTWYEETNGNSIILPGMSKPMSKWGGYVYSCQGLLYKPLEQWYNHDDPHTEDYYIYLKYDGYLLQNFFIAGGNKLNLVISLDLDEEYVKKFIIESLNDKEMRLKNYDGTLKVTYKRVAAGNGVKNVNANSDADETHTYYKLNGTAITHPTEGIYIDKTATSAKKIIVK